LSPSVSECYSSSVCSDDCDQGTESNVDSFASSRSSSTRESDSSPGRVYRCGRVLTNGYISDSSSTSRVSLSSMNGLSEKVLNEDRSKNLKVKFNMSTRNGFNEHTSPQLSEVKSRKLLLTIDSKELNDPCWSLMCIRKRFQEYGFHVKISQMEDQTEKLIIIFSDVSKSREAYMRSSEIGYRLQKTRPTRPSPAFLVQYKALHDLKIYDGKSSKARVIGLVKTNDIVTSNQLKCRRLRLIEDKANENEETITRGWVDLYMKNGQKSLLQLRYSNN